MKNIDFATAEAPFAGQDWEQAYASVKSDLMALSTDELLAVNLDIPSAVATAAGVIPEIAELRPQIVRELPAFDIERFDKLPEYAMAAGHAHSLLAVSTRPKKQIKIMYAEALELRELLRSDAAALGKRGLIDPVSLSNIGGRAGHKNVYADLRNLVNVFRAHWDSVAGRCATTQVEIKRAAQLSSALVQAVGLREQGPVEQSEAAQMRIRAFSLFVGTYQKVRRAVGYLRWDEGDVDSIIPSLYAARFRRVKKAVSAEVESTQDGAVSTSEVSEATETTSTGTPASFHSLSGRTSRTSRALFAQ